MKIDKGKFDLALARTCLTLKDLSDRGIHKNTILYALKNDVKPATAGRIAKALGVDVTEIIA